jgi:zinc protease
MLFEEMVFAGSPLAHPVRGYAGTVASIGRDDAAAFFKRHFTPESSVLVIAGDISADKALRLVKDDLSGWKGESTRKTGGHASEGGRFGRADILVVDRPGLTHSYVRIGNKIPSAREGEYYSLEVANNILGVGFTSRLKSEIRVERGLAYSVKSRTVYFDNTGYFGIFLTTGNETLGEALQAAKEEMARIGREPASDDELLGAKRYINGLYPFGFERRGDLCAALAEAEARGLEEDYFSSYGDSILAVGADDVLRVSRENFDPEKSKILVLTDYEATRGQLEGLGKVEVIGYKDIE